MCNTPTRYKDCLIYIYISESGAYHASVELPNYGGVVESNDVESHYQAQWLGIQIAEKWRID
jgi:hypothetical protein